MCDVSCVALFIVPSVNIPLSRTCELIKADGFHVVVNNHNVWLLRSHTELRRDRTTPLCCVPWQVTVHCVLVINGVHNVVDICVSNFGFILLLTGSPFTKLSQFLPLLPSPG